MHMPHFTCYLPLLSPCHILSLTVTTCHDLSQPVLLPNLHSMQVLSQVQNFDNLIVPVVDSLKYLSPLGYDMLSCIHPPQGQVEGVVCGCVQGLKGVVCGCVQGSRAWCVGVSRGSRAWCVGVSRGSKAWCGCVQRLKGVVWVCPEAQGRGVGVSVCPRAWCALLDSQTASSRPWPTRRRRGSNTRTPPCHSGCRVGWRVCVYISTVPCPVFYISHAPQGWLRFVVPCTRSTHWSWSAYSSLSPTS